MSGKMSFVMRLSLHETVTLIGLLTRGSLELSSRNTGCEGERRGRKEGGRERERERKREKEREREREREGGKKGGRERERVFRCSRKLIQQHKISIFVYTINIILLWQLHCAHLVSIETGEDL